MVKRSSSKRAYKKRGTVRKSRVIRRRKTTQRKAQRGGKFGDNAKGLLDKGVGYVSDKISGARYRLESQLGSSVQSPAPVLPNEPSPQNREAKARADAATAAAATKRAAADAAASVVKERQDAVDLQQSKLNDMNANATKTGWVDSNGEAAATFKKQQDSLRDKRNQLTAAKTAAAEAEAEAVAAEAEAEAA